MPAVAKEVLGRSGDRNINDGSRSFERPWVVYGAASELEAQGAVFLEAPALVDGLVLTHVSAKEGEVQDTYDCTANYGLPLPPEPMPPLEAGESSFHFEVATQSQRVFTPLQPQTVYPRPGLAGPADSSGWLIGQQGDGSQPEGVEVFEPIASFSETHILSLGTVTASMQRTLLRIVGKLNDAPFRGWQTEEVMCTGVSGSQRSGEDWEIGFRFGVREHQTDLTICGISGIDKRGWQYLWPRYSVKKDGSEPILANTVDYLVVADVFRTADFTNLGIGA